MMSWWDSRKDMVSSVRGLKWEGVASVSDADSSADADSVANADSSVDADSVTNADSSVDADSSVNADSSADADSVADADSSANADSSVDADAKNSGLVDWEGRGLPVYLMLILLLMLLQTLMLLVQKWSFEQGMRQIVNLLPV